MSITVTVKEIKPQRFKPEAIKKEVEAALKAEGKYHQKELKKTVATWRNKPQFESLQDTAGGDLIVITGPTGNTDAVQHWVWADKGTRRRVITAKRAPYLRFRRNYSAKTVSKQFVSYPGGSYGGWVRKKSVVHEIKAREWSETLSNRRKVPFRRAMFSAIKRGSDKVF